MLAKKKSRKLPLKNAKVDPFAHCEIKQICRSCRYVNEDYKAGLQEKFNFGISILQKSGAVPEAKILKPVPSPKKLAYRSSAKLAVRPSRRPHERFAIGLFQPESHQIVDISYCPIHTVAIGKCIRAIKSLLEKSTLSPWDETEQKGDLRYLAIRSNHVTDELMLTFVVATPCLPQLKSIVDELRATDHKIHSANALTNQSSGNVIFEGTAKRIAGQPRLRERLCELDFEISPTSFFQVNPWQAEQLYRRVEQIAGQSRNAVAWDLYCGIGQMTMILGRSGYKVVGIEENPQAIEDATGNIKRNHLADRIDLIAARVEHSLQQISPDKQSPELIVVNPSRKGIAESARLYLINVLSLNPKCRFVYVSCDVDSLARDLNDLSRSGFRVRQIEAFDMFPQTDKLEWLVVMTQ
jgi:23S rRNA (uracil1939-C5)-methyltransferase